MSKKVTTTRVAVMVPDAVVERLQAVVEFNKNRGWTLSDVVREALASWVSKLDTDP